MKKLRINDKEAIRFDGLRYNLTDLYRLTNLAGIRQEAWGWAQGEQRTRDISRRGWFFKKSWAKAPVLIEYASYLSHSLYRDVLRALNMDDVDKLIIILGPVKAASLDERVREELERERKLKAVAPRVAVSKVSRVVEPVPNLGTIPRFNADDVRAKPVNKTPARSMQMHRHGGISYQHHRSEPDVISQVMVYNALTDDYQSSSRSDVCHTPSHHDSGHSWSGDSGGSYDGGGGGCD